MKDLGRTGIGFVGTGAWIAGAIQEAVKNFESGNSQFEPILSSDAERNYLSFGGKDIGYQVCPELPDILKANPIAIVSAASSDIQPELAALCVSKNLPLMLPRHIDWNQIQKSKPELEFSKVPCLVAPAPGAGAERSYFEHAGMAFDLGEIRAYESSRAGIGLFRQDTNIVWDLAAEDIRHLLQLSGGRLPSEVCAEGSCRYADQPNLVTLSMTFGSFVARCSLSWTSPTQMHKLKLMGSKRSLQLAASQEPWANSRASNFSDWSLNPEWERGVGSMNEFFEFLAQEEKFLKWLPEVAMIAAAATESLECGGLPVSLAISTRMAEAS